MIELLHAKRDAIEALCRKHQVRHLDAFGSAVGGGFDETRSDLDFVVEFLPQPRHGLGDVYFRLLHDLEALLGRPVDLVEASAIRNPYFRASFEATRTPIYAAA